MSWLNRFSSSTNSDKEWSRNSHPLSTYDKRSHRWHSKIDETEWLRKFHRENIIMKIGPTKEVCAYNKGPSDALIDIEHASKNWSVKSQLGNILHNFYYNGQYVWFGNNWNVILITIIPFSKHPFKKTIKCNCKHSFMYLSVFQMHVKCLTYSCRSSQFIID